MKLFIPVALFFTAIFVLISCGDDASAPTSKCTKIDTFKCTKDGHSKYCDESGRWIEEGYCNYGCNTSTGKCYTSPQDSGSGENSGNGGSSSGSSECSGSNFRCKNSGLSQRCWDGAWVDFEECVDGKKCDSASGRCKKSESGNNDEPVSEEESCANTEGSNCSTDDECGECMICASGRCTKGCTSDSDCTELAGTNCNKKLARCVNIYASRGACAAENCPTGCCYAEKGLTGLKCAKTPNIETCGSCQQNSIYSPVEQRCVSAVCSTTTDNCPAINQGATNPPSRCYECRAGELLCSPTASTEGCSAAAVINMKECIPSGKRCDANQNCCSGFACIEGYCY